VPWRANLSSPDADRRAGFTMLDSGTHLKQIAAALVRAARLFLLHSERFLRAVEV
jgi:transposase-like protein